MSVYKKVGIMGGTFNPIHMGHLIMAESAREFFSLDEVLFIPSGCSYMKSNVDMPEAVCRCEMTKIAIEDNPFFRLSTIELEREGNTYTFETIAQLIRENPDTEYYFIIGADTLFTMDNWKSPEKIFHDCIVTAAIRGDKTSKEIKSQILVLKNKYQADIRLLPFKQIDISSTNIREKAGNNQSIRYLVPDKVMNYISAQQIYQITKRN